MRKITLAAALVCALALCFALAGCGNVDKSRYAGEWKLAYGSAENVSSDVVETMESFGLQTTLSLNEDGTGELNLFGDGHSLTWQASSDIEGTISIDDMGQASMTLANSELAVANDDGETMTFTRSE